MPTTEELIKGIIDKVSDSLYFEDVAWVLNAPIINHTMGIVDRIIKANVDLHGSVGLKPRIIRKEVGNCCEWCKSIVGEYNYPDVPEEVYQRHDRCKCIVEYYPGNGKKQDVYTKKWQDENADEIKQRIETINNLDQ